MASYGAQVMDSAEDNVRLVQLSPLNEDVTVAQQKLVRIHGCRFSKKHAG